jgi:hypothetical protein
MAGRYLIENRDAAIGVQVLHMRQRRGAAVWRAQTQVLLEEAESRRAADTAAEASCSCRSHASGSSGGGGLGGDSSCWGAGYGGDVRRVDRRWSGGCLELVLRVGERRQTRLAGACGGQSRVFFWGGAALLGL